MMPRLRKFKLWHSALSDSMHKIGWFILLFFIVLAFLAPILANDKPLAAKWKSHWIFPAITGQNYFVLISENDTLLLNKTTEWKTIDWNFVLFPPVTYSPGKTDILNGNYVSPGGKQVESKNNGKIVVLESRFRHFLGTDKIGRDVFSGLIHGARTSLLIGFASMFIAGVLGIFLGGIAGYYGDNGLRLHIGGLLFMSIAVVPAYFYGFVVQKFIPVEVWQTSTVYLLLHSLFSILIFIGILVLFYATGWLVTKKWWKKTIALPIDSIINKLIEVIISLPAIILIIAFAAITERSMANVILIIGLVSWTGIARLVRADMLKTRQLEYIESAKALGYSHWRILFRHALPNCLSAAGVAIVFGISGAILTEAALSFLNIGVPPGIVTWGSMLREGQNNLDAWWLIVFPGLAIFLLVIAINILGDAFRARIDPFGKLQKLSAK